MNRPHYTRSLASRITLLTTICVGLAVLLVSIAAYAVVRIQSTQALDDSLRERAQAAVGSKAFDAQTSTAVPLWFFGATDVRIAFVDAAAGRVYSADRAIASAISAVETRVAVGEQTWSARTVTIAGEHYRMVAVPTDNPGDALILAQSLEPTEAMLDRLGLVALLLGLAGMVMAAVGGWAVARGGLRPVRRLTAAAEHIARTEELDPIPVEGKDEIARLAMAFNAMLVSLAASRTRQRQLVADAGHELRTPLTSLRTNLDLLAQADARDDGRLSRESRAELIGDVRAQITELTTLIGDLVELAREEPGSPAQRQEVDLAAVVDAAVARVRLRAPGLTFDTDLAGWIVDGDPPALERAVTNLLDNAAKWSPAGGTVRVRLAEGTLMVGDAGPGISPTDLPLVFERFYRSTGARSMPGSGLGLSIVKAVAERHGGVVRAGTGPDGGAGFWFSVPGRPAPVTV
ncbi:HAMP domain-containing sensor histidine kinase [Alteromonas gracilis]